MSDVSSRDTPELREDSDAEALLGRWQSRMLQGVTLTCVVAIVPALAIMIWQWLHGVPGLEEGLTIGVVATFALSALALWRGPHRHRAALLVGVGYVFVTIAIFADGFSPAQYPAICTVTTIAVLLYSLRVASLLLAASTAAIMVAAYLFHIGYLTPIHPAALDVRNPLNWVRVILFTVFPSATAAVAVGYLVDKLRQTLNARSELVARLRDEVVQRERTLAELEATQTRLLQTQKLEAIGKLAAGIAHDFNNTLSVIAMEAELLKRRHKEAASVVQSADALLSAADRGSQLTRQLLLFNRMEAERRPVIDIVQAFEECVQVLTRLLPSEITFQVEIAQSPLHVCILPGELQQLVLNLGINARDAMETGGSLHLRLEPCELTAEDAPRLGVAAGRYVRFTCRDTGAGMDPVTLSRVFEPFFTTKKPGRGTGLGLTTVWSIVQRASGSIQVDSTPNVGSCLEVYLPLSSDVPDAARAPVAPLPGTSETVLVVEDDIRVRALLVTLLADAGYVVLEAQSADAALNLERAHTGPIDLICTDVVMPGMPAREFLDEMQLRRPDAGVLVCSGYPEDERIARGISSGEFLHLGKPFTSAALLAAVREALVTRPKAQLPRSAPSELTHEG